MHQEFNLTHYTKIVSKAAIFKFYEPERVEGYCKSCPNYNKLWSCPPHEFDAISFLNPYTSVLLLGEKIVRNECSEFNDSMNSYFQKVRRQLGDQLITLSKKEDVEVLIAGNCYLCDDCLRTEGKSCRYEDRMKYSLESIGFLVGDIASELLGIGLEWPEEGKEATSLMTVGAIFAKDETLLESILEQSPWR
jgi:predicted metal-binding protein